MHAIHNCEVFSVSQGCSRHSDTGFLEPEGQTATIDSI